MSVKQSIDVERDLGPLWRAAAARIRRV